MSDTINLHNLQCIKSITRVGYEHYFNVCDGSSFDTPWGVIDWGLLVFVLLMLVPIIIMLICFVGFLLNEALT